MIEHGILLDHTREERLGFDEAVYAAGKSVAQLDAIAAHALQPRYEYRHRWNVNDMVLWDNRRMMHMAAGWPYGQQRFAYRTTLKGGMEVGRPYAMSDGASMLSVFA